MKKIALLTLSTLAFLSATEAMIGSHTPHHPIYGYLIKPHHEEQAKELDALKAKIEEHKTRGEDTSALEKEHAEKDAKLKEDLEKTPK